MGWIHNAPDDTATDGPMIVAVSGVLTGTSLCFVLLRAYVRGRLLHAFGIDDWILFVTWLLSCSFTVVLGIQTTWGLGMKNIEEIPKQNVQTFQILELAGSPLYILGVLGFKLSLLVSYFRFAPNRAYKYGITGVIVSCILFNVACLIVQLDPCQPIQKKWDPTIPGTCVNLVPFYQTSSGMAIVFDFAVMFLPFPLLIRTKIQTRKKVVLLGLFALGFFITAIQIIRIQYLKGLKNPLNSGPVILWSSVEANLGVIVACVPVLSPLFKKFHNNSRNSTCISSWGNITTPSATSRSHTVSKHHVSGDQLLDVEGNHNGHLAATDSQVSMVANEHIVKEVDIVVLNQLAPVHLEDLRSMELGGPSRGNYECWARGTNMTFYHGDSSNSLDSI
ncbi:hypothetical protein K445DRAFT_311779 [Daldinia sp. EC12]|nr:hypothetical protein K445DRAFT_311779 [Daldinia sp. EC12]